MRSEGSASNGLEPHNYLIECYFQRVYSPAAMGKSIFEFYKVLEIGIKQDVCAWMNRFCKLGVFLCIIRMHLFTISVTICQQLVQARLKVGLRRRSGKHWVETLSTHLGVLESGVLFNSSNGFVGFLGDCFLFVSFHFLYSGWFPSLFGHSKFMLQLSGIISCSSGVSSVFMKIIMSCLVLSRLAIEECICDCIGFGTYLMFDQLKALIISSMNVGVLV